jgi:hypothetical protein
MNEAYARAAGGAAAKGKPALWAIAGALWRAVRRDLGTFGSIVANNFFLFIALLMYGAFSAGVRPVTAYPYLVLLFFLMLFPLAADPLAKIPAVRLGLWPLSRRQRLGLRAVALALSPMLWLVAVLAARLARPAFALVVLVVPLLTHSLSAPRWQPLRKLPAFGELMRKNLRQILSVLDPYLAALLALIAVVTRVQVFDGGAAGMAMLVALALSTYTQCQFSLDGPAGAARHGLLPLPPWRILLAKDAAYLAVLFVLVLPVEPVAGLSCGFLALAIGRYPSLRYRLPVMRWRFSSGRVFFGVLQIVAGAAILAQAAHRWTVLGVAGGAWLVSLGWGSRMFRRVRQ